MAKLKHKYIKMRVEEESTISYEKLRKKLSEIMDFQYRKNLKKLKGSPQFFWSEPQEDRYVLKYYHSYGEDMCDTVMTVDLEKGLERCSVHGFIHKPKSIWAIFWGVIASVFIDFLIISYCVLFTGNFDLGNALMISGCVCLVRIYICTSLIELDRSRIRCLREELMRVIKNEQEAELYRQQYDEMELAEEYEEMNKKDDDIKVEGEDE